LVCSSAGYKLVIRTNVHAMEVGVMAAGSKGLAVSGRRGASCSGGRTGRACGFVVACAAPPGRPIGGPFGEVGLGVREEDANPEIGVPRAMTLWNSPPQNILEPGGAE
jgi:hypothetical protein